MRVEHEGQYAIVASKGGETKHPGWYFNLKAHPDEVRVRDGPEIFDVTVREVEGDERDQWWERVWRHTRLRRVPGGHGAADPGPRCHPQALISPEPHERTIGLDSSTTLQSLGTTTSKRLPGPV